MGAFGGTGPSPKCPPTIFFDPKVLHRTPGPLFCNFGLLLTYCYGDTCFLILTQFPVFSEFVSFVCWLLCGQSKLVPRGLFFCIWGVLVEQSQIRILSVNSTDLSNLRPFFHLHMAWKVLACCTAAIIVADLSNRGVECPTKFARGYFFRKGLCIWLDIQDLFRVFPQKK